MIVDGGSCVNVVSTTLVKKLNFNTTKHYKPYSFSDWMNVENRRLISRFWLHFLLGDIVMKFYVMSFLCMHVIYYWGGHDSLIGRLYMMGLEIGIFL
jgi:hypothetical protein